MYKGFRDFLFNFDAEKVHVLAEFFLSTIANKPLIQDFLVDRFFYTHPSLVNNVCGLVFPNPVGLAAGFDKNAVMMEALASLGFGFLELGTFTRFPQEGNPKPRLWRHVNVQSLQNSMGFNNCGIRKGVENLSKSYPFCLPIGLSFGKNKNAKDALYSYTEVLNEALEVGDYYVFNLSSPNTPNLRNLENSTFVQELFSMVKKVTSKPAFLKISPDMPLDAMLNVCESAISSGADGIIATNTTMDYSLIPGSNQVGGLSGRVLRQKSLEVFRVLAKSFFKKAILVSVGGIDSANEVYSRIRLGASLVQVFTHFIYEGPSLCKKINSELVELMKRDGFGSISEVIGVDL